MKADDAQLEQLLDTLQQRSAGGAGAAELEALRAQVRERVRALGAFADALRDSEERFRAVAENIPQLAWMTDAEGNIIWFNRRWIEYTGHDLSAMQAFGWTSVHHPQHPYSIVERWNETVRSGRPWEDTFQLRAKDGSYRWFLSRAFPIHDASGRITRYFGTNTDITELRETQEALARAHRELQLHASQLEATVAERTARLRATVEELEAFSYSLSHDMRSPLQAIVGFCQLIDEDHGPALGEDGRLLLQRIRSAARRLDQLINDVLAYSRLSRDQVSLQAVDPTPVVRQLVEENPALQPPQTEVVLQEPLQSVLGHEASLMQVVSNLVYNAVKFVAPGVKPRIEISTVDAGDQVQLVIRDNGIGFPPECRDRIFSLFQRFHPERRYEGTGVGLAIVRKAVERMGGSVGVDSEVNRGSVFTVTLRKP